MPVKIPTYDCIPPCKACRDAGVCGKAIALSAREDVRLREIRNMHSDSAVLPCGHWGIPWPVVEHFGQNMKEVFCDTCMKWVRITKTWDKEAKSGIKVSAPTLFDEEPGF